MPQGLHHPGPADSWPCTVLSHLPGLYIPQNPVRSPLQAPLCHSGLRTGQGTKPRPALVGCGEPRIGAPMGKGLEQLMWVNLIFLELGAHTRHGTGVRAGLKECTAFGCPFTGWDSKFHTSEAPKTLRSCYRCRGWASGETAVEILLVKYSSLCPCQQYHPSPAENPPRGPGAAPPHSSCLWNTGKTRAEKPIFLPD